MVKFSGSDFTWKRGAGFSTLVRLGIKGFPSDFTIRSSKTGALRTFISDHVTNEANEFFDGEGSAYISTDGLVKVQIWAGE